MSNNFTGQSYTLFVILIYLPHIQTCHINYQSSPQFVKNITNDKRMLKYDSENSPHYIFRNVCSPTQNFSTCVFLSPENKNYYTFPKNEVNCTHYENGRICVEYMKPNICLIKIKHILPKDIGLWHCLYRTQVEEKVVDHDAVVLRRTDLLETLHLFNTFNVTHPQLFNNKHFRIIHMSPIFIVSSVVITFLLLYFKRIKRISPEIESHIQK